LDLLNELRQALQEAPGKAAGLVISGSPGMFTGGLDLTELVGLDDAGMLRFVGAFFEVLEALGRLPIPVAAAVTGHGPAAGTVLSLLCDRRIMARGRFLFGFSEAQIGIVMPQAILSVMELRLGWHRAVDLVVTGRLVGPEEALELALVDELAEPGEVVPRALTWVEGLLALPREPMLEARRRARQPLLEAMTPHLGEGPEGFLRWLHHPEAKAALKAALARLKA